MKRKTEALAALAADCYASHVYLNEQGQTCPIGCLALLAGVPRPVLIGAGSRCIDGEPDNPRIAEIAEAVCGHFGLTVPALAEIQETNDATYGDTGKPLPVETRRRRVLALVNTEPDDFTDSKGGN